MNYYNEIDPKKAAWLKELIKENLIAPGEVDERSIADVRAADLRGYRQCHFFAGIGVWSYALRLAGWPDDKEVWTGSCPCPSFSAAGKGSGFADPRHLWPQWAGIIRESEPFVIFGEQSADAIGHGWLDLVSVDLERESYAVGSVVFPACSVGAPHKRQRLYWVADAEHAERRAEQQEHRDAYGRNGSGRRSVDERLADNGGAGLSERERDGRVQSGAYGASSRKSAERDCNSVRLAHADGRLPGDGGIQRSGEYGQRTEDGRVVPMDGLDDSAGSRYDGPIRDTEGSSRNDSRLRVPESRGEIGGVGESGERRRRTYERDNDARQLDDARSGSVNGFWRQADWVLTRPQRMGDRPGLRPIEPGTFPLVDGAPARVGRLRGYGDAIVAQQAAEFIKAYSACKK
jgi:DNA (cytosine-5)-methyltransferase 1